MGFFHHGGDEHQQYEQFEQSENKAELSHEVISGAAAYEAAKAYERHCEQNGQPQSHAEAKEILAGFAGAFIDREFETRGMDTFDREKAKYSARHRAEEGLRQSGQY